ncbi:hypothetical protein ACQJBY_051848 [Aegilops geniculata]
MAFQESISYYEVLKIVRFAPPNIPNMAATHSQVMYSYRRVCPNLLDLLFHCILQIQV